MCNHIFLKLTHEFDVMEGVYLQLGQLVIETALADLGRLSDVRLHRELLARGLPVRVATLPHLKQLRVTHCILNIVETCASRREVS